MMNLLSNTEAAFNQKAKDSNKNIENLNKEMNNLATIIDDLRKQYINMQKWELIWDFIIMVFRIFQPLSYGDK